MPAKQDWVSVSTGEGRLDLEAQACWVGPGPGVVVVTGGEVPHVGAVAMAAPRPSLADPARTSATASVFTYLSHKEGPSGPGHGRGPCRPPGDPGWWSPPAAIGTTWTPRASSR